VNGLITVTFVKIGYIGTTIIIEALLDERSARKDISMRVISCGVSMSEEDSLDVANVAAGIESDLYVIISPNAALKGPKTARERLAETGKPIILVSDEPSRKAMRALPEEYGFFVIYGDPMISAKSIYLDPVEMALFNADVLKTLAVTGAFRLIQTEIDKVIDQIKEGKKPELPRMVITKAVALASSEIQNHHAKGKAMAAYEINRTVAKLSTEGVFRLSESEEARPVLAAAHEMARQAALLADEAREIEKSNDTAVRIAHFSKGDRRRKVGLADKYTR
jgi:methylenetetrahydromethanopterin dehydrogenase